MIRVLLLSVVPFFTPAVVYILWRTFAPASMGGSSAIARDEWEPLPWRWLIPVGVALMLIAIAISIMYPEFLDGFG